MTALQALAGWGANTSEPAASQAPAAQPQQPSHVGTWTASLPNGARVQLTLQASGAFRWIATNRSGTNSTFEGSYTVSNGSLTLVRSNDNQKLAGNMTSSSNTAFNFKLNGAKDAGLNFVRG